MNNTCRVSAEELQHDHATKWITGAHRAYIKAELLERIRVNDDNSVVQAVISLINDEYGEELGYPTMEEATESCVEWNLDNHIGVVFNFGIVAHRTQKDVAGKPHYNLFIGGRDARLFHTRIGFGPSRKRQRASQEEDNPSSKGASRSETVPCIHQPLWAIVKKTAPHSNI